MAPRNPAKTRLGAALLLGLALLCLTIPASASAGRETLSAARPTTPVAQQPLYWGAWIGDQLTGTEAQWDTSAVTDFQEAVGKGLSLVQISSMFATCHYLTCSSLRFPTEQMQDIRDYGAIPFLSWASASGGAPHQPDYQLSDLISGRHDRYIREFAEDARDWEHPFFLRFDWEMNGDWFPWGVGVNDNQPGEYVAAWRHVHDIFASVGATNATWVWCPYAYEEEGVWTYYPGSGYVDWTCLDAFNWGPSSPEPAPWTNFRAIFGPAYEYIVRRVAPDKPMIIGEVASSGEGPKARWIRNMFAALREEFRRVRGLIWFNKIDRGVDWPLESAAAAAHAFRVGTSKGFRANIYGDLEGSPILPPARLAPPANLP